MDLLINNNIFDSYFNNNSLKSEQDILIYNIINNRSARIILNEDLKNDIINTCEDKRKQQLIKSYFQSLLNKDKQRILIAKISDISDDNDAKYVEIAKNYLNIEDNNGILIYLDLNYDANTQEKIGKSYTSIKNEKNDNKFSPEWFKVQLAAYSKLSFRYLDFQNQHSLDNLLKDVFSLPIFEDVIVIDRYINFLKEWDRFNTEKNYHIFECLKGKKFSVYSLDIENQKLLGGSLNDFNLYLNTSLKTFSTQNHGLIHERKMFFHNFILECDEDLTQISHNRQTWKVDITYDKKLSEELQSKLQNFTPFQVT
jgi:hypothetical protein